MFTGIIAESGKVESFSKKGDTARLVVGCGDVGASLKTGDSVAVNGVCLSLTGRDGGLMFDVVGNTLLKTNLKRLRPGDAVNLEGPLKMGDNVSGHMVSGHVDRERRVKSNRKTPEGWTLEINVLAEDRKYLVPRGSVAVDGVSLTVGRLTGDALKIFLIPHTIENTTLKLKKTGDYVNLEFDIMAKYAVKEHRKAAITEDVLREKGFI